MAFAEKQSETLVEHAKRLAQEAGAEYRYLQGKPRKDKLVDEILLNPTVAGEYVAKSNGTNAQQKAPEKSGLNPEKRLS